MCECRWFTRDGFPPTMDGVTGRFTPCTMKVLASVSGFDSLHSTNQQPKHRFIGHTLVWGDVAAKILLLCKVNFDTSVRDVRKVDLNCCKDWFSAL